MKNIVLVGYSRIGVADGPDVKSWSSRCTCGWRGEPSETEEQARDKALTHSIAEGHQPAWLEKWPE